MNVRCALLDRIEQYFIDETYDRSIFDIISTQRFCARGFVSARDLQVFEVEVVVRQARHDRFGLIDGLADGQLKLVVFDHHELDTHRGLEANLVQRV